MCVLRKIFGCFDRIYRMITDNAGMLECWDAGCSGAKIPPVLGRGTFGRMKIERRLFLEPFQSILGRPVLFR